MNRILLFLLFLSALALSLRASASSSIESIFVDTVKDCAVVSASTDQAPIDFYEAECKAFAGFRFGIKGSDLRYGPILSYQSTDIVLESPQGFYDLADTSIEWIYQRDFDNEGTGSIQWKGLIYALTVYDDEKSATYFYPVRLEAEKSCALPVGLNQETAKKSILDSASICK